MPESETITIDPEVAASVAAGNTTVLDHLSPEAREVYLKANPPKEEEGDKKVEDTKPETDTKVEDQKTEGDEKKDADSLEIEKTPDKPEPTQLRADIEEMATEYYKTGELSDDNRAKVVKALFRDDADPAVVNEYIDGYLTNMKAAATAALATTAATRYDIVGGPEKYAEIASWAKDNLTNEEKVAYNAVAQGVDEAAASMAIKGLAARYAGDASSTREPNLSHGSHAGPGVPALSGRAALRAIQKTEQYKTDPAYRAAVMQQLRDSMESGEYTA